MATINDLGMPNPISVGFGGTGVATNATPYGVVCAGTTATNPLQNVVSVGTAGQVLTSNGAGALPTFQPFSGGVVPNYTAPTAWTPVLQFGGASVGIVYTQQFGYYMQIGQLVTYYMWITLSSVGSSVGNATITNFPVAALNTGFLITTFGDIAGGFQNMQTAYSIGAIDPSTTTLNLYQITSANVPSQNTTPITNNNWLTGSGIFISGFYFSN